MIADRGLKLRYVKDYQKVTYTEILTDLPIYSTHF